MKTATPRAKHVTPCPPLVWVQVSTIVDALPLPTVEASSGQLFMGIENNGMVLKGTNFGLRPKLYFDSALPENAQQQVWTGGDVSSFPSHRDTDAVDKICRRCSYLQR